MINAYFENIHIQIIKEISRAQQSIKLCVAWFTDVELYNHILRAQERGVIVKIVIANHEFNLIDKNPVDFKELLLNNGTVNYIGNLTNDYTDSLMHHKFCIVDNKVLMTGSYNWTRKARQNDENLLVIEDEAEVVKSFEEKFKNLNPTHIFTIENDKVLLFPIQDIVKKWDKSTDNNKLSTILDINTITNKF